MEKNQNQEVQSIHRKKIYCVFRTYVLEGWDYVKADSEEEAEESVDWDYHKHDLEKWNTEISFFIDPRSSDPGDLREWNRLNQKHFLGMPKISEEEILRAEKNRGLRLVKEGGEA